MNTVEKYCEEQGFKLAKKIDDSMSIIIKPRKWYIPRWLYNKVINKSIEIIKQP